MSGKLFPLGGPVSEKDLVDRENFIFSLRSRLSEGQSVMLAGPRRIGKTSLAYEVLRQLKKKGFYTATVDLFRISGMRDFATALIDACVENRTGAKKTLTLLKDRAKAIAETAKLSIKLQDLEINFGFLEKKPDNDLLDYALSLPGILTERDKTPMVVLFDEFQEAARIIDSEVYKRMRSHFQTHERVSYLFLGSKEGMMKTLFAEHKQAFYRFATILPIPPVPEEAWINYIKSKFTERNITTSDTTIKEIVRLTGGHPQDTMSVCSEIYYALLETGENNLSLDFVRLGYDRALLTLAPIFDEILDELGKRSQARNILQKIAKGENIYTENLHPNTVKRNINYLINKGILEKKRRGEYTFIEPMFRQYLLSL